MITLKFDKIKKLSEHFEVPPDFSTWNGQYRNIPKEGQTPDRQQASFGSLTKALVPTTPFASELQTTFGIYVIGVEWPSPAIYIGIAAGGSKSPEGILKRIRKHRVKLTASHLGSTAQSVGGVNHTSGWRDIAKPRAAYFQTLNEIDRCTDIWFTVGKAYDDSGSNLTDKMTLEIFESMLVWNHQDLYKTLSQIIWPQVAKVADCLTVRSRKLKDESALAHYQVQFESV